MSKYMSSNKVNEQEYEQVVFSGPKRNFEKSEEYKNASRTKTTHMERCLDKTTDAIAQPEPLLETRMIIQKARMGKKMTQKELAQAMKPPVTPSVITKWENGSEQPVGAQKACLQRILGVKIPTSKKTKKVDI